MQKPDVPTMHLVSYLVALDEARGELLLVAHRTAGLWLPSGGHVEPMEDPWDTVLRECGKLSHLLEIEHVAPESLRYNVVLHEMIRELLERERLQPHTRPSPDRHPGRGPEMSQSRMLYIVATGAPLTRRVADVMPLARAWMGAGRRRNRLGRRMARPRRPHEARCSRSHRPQGA
jgi:hypothetical protein